MEMKSSYPLMKVSSDQPGSDAAAGLVADLRLADGEAGSFSREPGLHVQIDGSLDVSLTLLQLAGLLVLTRLRQPLVIVPTQGVQLRVTLQPFWIDLGST